MSAGFWNALCPWCGQPRYGPHRTVGCLAHRAMREAIQEFCWLTGRCWRARLMQFWEGNHPNQLPPRTTRLLMEARRVIGPVRIYKVQIGRPRRKSPLAGVEEKRLAEQQRLD